MNFAVFALDIVVTNFYPENRENLNKVARKLFKQGAMQDWRVTLEVIITLIQKKIDLLKSALQRQRARRVQRKYLRLVTCDVRLKMMPRTGATVRLAEHERICAWFSSVPKQLMPQWIMMSTNQEILKARYTKLFCLLTLDCHSAERRDALFGAESCAYHTLQNAEKSSNFAGSHCWVQRKTF